MLLHPRHCWRQNGERKYFQLLHSGIYNSVKGERQSNTQLRNCNSSWGIDSWTERLLDWDPKDDMVLLKKNRDITLLTKVWIIKAMVFLVSMYRCESWTIKKAEHWRIDTFELWCWRRLLRVPWTARRSNQSILEEINPEYSVQELNAEDEVPVLWPPEAKSQFIGKAPDTGKDWGQEKGATEDEMIGWHHRLNGRDFEKILGNSEGQGSLVCCSPWGCKESDMI